MTDDSDSWLASRKATNQLLGFAIVVLAAGFVSIGDGKYGGLRVLAESLLVFVLLGSFFLFLGLLLREDGRNGDE